MTKHTNGPWEVVNDGDRITVLGPAKNCNWRGRKNKWDVCRVDCSTSEDIDRLRQEDISNALLIAAAPELLEALVELFADGAGASYANWTHAQHAAHAAIAKATGATA